MSQAVSMDLIKTRIFIIRGKRVLLDKDLASLYQVKPIALRQQVKRNRGRFPDDFMFRLTKQEAEILVSQNVIPSLRSMGGSLPYVFTQEGIAMLSSVLKSDRAIQVNIAIMRAFVQIREMLLTHKELAAKIEVLELKYKDHDRKFSEHDAHIADIFEAIRELMAPPPDPPKKRIGFITD